VSMSPDDLRLNSQRAALLLVDFQERLAAVMAPGEIAACQRNIVLLFELARQLRIPVVVSEQYPRGLGPTVPALKLALSEPGLTIDKVEKIEFSCVDSPAFKDVHRRLGRDQWIVVGMEAHVCVYQTARDLVALGARVHVPADAVISRAPANVRIGLELCTRAGAIVTGTETVVFDALRRAGTDEFRALSRLLK
jgi:nicotinamidase-related amidase